LKFIKVTIKRDINPDNPTMKYPEVYNADVIESVKAGPIIYDGGLSRGEDTEECLILVSDQIADTYNQDPDISILTKTEAETWIANNTGIQEQPDEQITDSNRLLAILAKQAVGQAFSQEDLDAVNPDKPVKGIEKIPKTLDTIYTKANISIETKLAE